MVELIGAGLSRISRAFSVSVTDYSVNLSVLRISPTRNLESRLKSNAVLLHL